MQRSVGAVWDRRFTIGQLFYVILQYCVSPTSAGVCWTNINSSTGLCKGPFNYNMTQEKCCSIKMAVNVSWSPHDHLTSAQLFFLEVVAGGAPKCHRCHKSCRNVVCESDKQCRMKKGVPHCVCRPQCDHRLKRLGHFCGTDGRRYRNYCTLQRHNCRSIQQIEISYLGNCKRSCRNVQCFNNRHCLEDQNGYPHCVQCYEKCPYRAPTEYLCGEDGLTYNNTCDLKAAVCQKGKSIRIAYFGKCRDNATCSTAECSSGMTCLTDPDSGHPVCTDCVHMCDTSIRVPVCGTDRRTYSSYCEMQLHACNTGVVIRTKRSGPCKAGTQDSRKRPLTRRKIRQRNKKRKEKLRARKMKRKSNKLKGSSKKVKKTSENHVIKTVQKTVRLGRLPHEKLSDVNLSH